MGGPRSPLCGGADGTSTGTDWCMINCPLVLPHSNRLLEVDRRAKEQRILLRRPFVMVTDITLMIECCETTQPQSGKSISEVDNWTIGHMCSAEKSNHTISICWHPDITLHNGRHDVTKCSEEPASRLLYPNMMSQCITIIIDIIL